MSQEARACSKCGSTTNGFYKCSRVKDGLTAWCKACFRDHKTKHYAKHPDKLAEKRAAALRWAKANPQKAVKKALRYQRNHPDRAWRTRTRRHLSDRRPAYANPFFIGEAYHLARLRSKLLGERWVVDHVIPLTHSLVCGLHVETNLAVVPHRVNAAKGNSFIQD